MSDANANVSSGRNNNLLIIAITVVVLAIVLMYFRDRHQKRALELQRLESQVDVWEEWGLPQQNRQLNNAPDKGEGKIL